MQKELPPLARTLLLILLPLMTVVINEIDFCKF